MVAPKRRSIGLPIILSSISVALTIALLVGWTLVLVSNRGWVQDTISGRVGLLVGGIVSFAAIIAVIVLFTVFLIKEISEVRRQTGFIDSVTHELKTPLASLRLAAETLARPKLVPERREQLRRMMIEDVERLGTLVDGILDASRLLDGREAGDLAEVDLAELIEAVRREQSRRHAVDPAEIEVDLDDNLRFVTDRHALRTVLTNLVDNALKYSDAPAQIRIRARRSTGRQELELAVSDRGIGIAKGDLKRIFNRFYRVPEEPVRSRHGTGLGLFVVAALVRGLGGRIEASSPGVGHGTTFRVLLPMRSDD